MSDQPARFTEHKLLFPVTSRGESVTDVTVRRPTVADLENSRGAGNEHAQNKRLIVDLTGLDPEAINQLDLADYDALWEIVGNFRSAGE